MRALCSSLFSKAPFCNKICLQRTKQVPLGRWFPPLLLRDPCHALLGSWKGELGTGRKFCGPLSDSSHRSSIYNP